MLQRMLLSQATKNALPTYIVISVASQTRNVRSRHELITAWNGVWCGMGVVIGLTCGSHGLAGAASSILLVLAAGKGGVVRQAGCHCEAGGEAAQGRPQHQQLTNPCIHRQLRQVAPCMTPPPVSTGSTIIVTASELTACQGWRHLLQQHCMRLCLGGEHA